jgi:hypothetical protein
MSTVNKLTRALGAYQVHELTLCPVYSLAA